MLIAAGAAVILFMLATFLLWRAPGSLDAADGSFAHDCCGTIRLDHGRMFLNEKQAVAYSVGQDAAGPYILPKTYVGAFEDMGFELDGTRPALKLRLDRLPDPSGVLMFEGGKRYVLKRLPRKNRDLH